MWQNITNGILGIWIIALFFIGFSDSLQQILLIISGLAIMIISFFGNIIIKSTNDLRILEKQQEKEIITNQRNAVKNKTP